MAENLKFYEPNNLSRAKTKKENKKEDYSYIESQCNQIA